MCITLLAPDIPGTPTDPAPLGGRSTFSFHTKLLAAARRCSMVVAIAAASLMACAEPTEVANPKLNVALDARVDFEANHTIGEKGHTTGFYGRYFNVHVNGSINSKWSYGLRQRLNKFADLGNDVFSATDWLWLQFAPTEHWSVSAGKQVVLIGGYEYDAPPIDIFYASRFWNNIACYQFGVSATYTVGKQHLTFQVCNSPYQSLGKSCYAYNLYWAGRIGCFSSLWSVNLIEYSPGHYANFIALGNRFDLNRVELEVDLMNRASGGEFFGHDFTVIGKATWRITDWMSVFAKGGYDKFKPMLGAPEHADNPFYGGGFEFFPNKGSRNIRLHAVVDRVSNNLGTCYTQVMTGVKWRVNLYSR